MSNDQADETDATAVAIVQRILLSYQPGAGTAMVDLATLGVSEPVLAQAWQEHRAHLRVLAKQATRLGLDAPADASAGEDGEQPAYRFNDHRNDIGDWCPSSKTPAPSKPDEDERCPNDCRGSFVEDVTP